MDNTLELLGITDSNIKITRFSAESVNGRNSYMNPRQRKRRRCWYVTVPIWKNTGENDGNKKLHSISEVKFSRSSTPFDKDP